MPMQRMVSSSRMPGPPGPVPGEFSVNVGILLHVVSNKKFFFYQCVVIDI